MQCTHSIPSVSQIPDTVFYQIKNYCAMALNVHFKILKVFSVYWISLRRILQNKFAHSRPTPFYKLQDIPHNHNLFLFRPVGHEDGACSSRAAVQGVRRKTMTTAGAGCRPRILFSQKIAVPLALRSIQALLEILHDACFFRATLKWPILILT